MNAVEIPVRTAVAFQLSRAYSGESFRLWRDLEENERQRWFAVADEALWISEEEEDASLRSRRERVAFHLHQAYDPTEDWNNEECQKRWLIVAEEAMTTFFPAS